MNLRAVAELPEETRNYVLHTLSNVINLTLRAVCKDLQLTNIKVDTYYREPSELGVEFGLIDRLNPDTIWLNAWPVQHSTNVSFLIKETVDTVAHELRHIYQALHDLDPIENNIVYKYQDDPVEIDAVNYAEGFMAKDSTQDMLDFFLDKVKEHMEDAEDEYEGGNK